jgi:cell division protein FtsZ
MTDILLVGVGGAGCHIAQQCGNRSSLPVLLINTDRHSLPLTSGFRTLPIGPAVCGGRPALNREQGRRAAEESAGELAAQLCGVNRIAVIAGLGGATGTGALPVVARLAQEAGSRVVAAVTMPFSAEHGRKTAAAEGLKDLMAIGIPIHVNDHSAVEATAPDASIEALISEAVTAVNDAIGSRTRGGSWDV